MRQKILIVLLVFVLAFIWGHSCMPVESSREESSTAPCWRPSSARRT